MLGLLTLTALAAIPLRGDTAVTPAMAVPSLDVASVEEASELRGSLADVPVTLRGSLSAMMRQHSVALALGYPFVESRGDMIEMEASGELVRLEGNEDYGFRQGVRSLLARPQTALFIERLGRDYRAACGEQLVVTSLTRPLDRQPSNAHRLSVHPAGIAVDLRVSRSPACRGWLESELLAMEDRGLLDVTREYYPPHYHIALFPEAYMAAVAPLLAAEEEAQAAAEQRARLQAERELARYQAVEGIGSRPAMSAAGSAAERLSALGLLPLAVGVVVILRRGGAGRAEAERAGT